MTVTPIVPPDMRVVGQFTPAFRLSNGDLVVCSGIVPVDAAGESVGAGDAFTQTRQVLTNLRTVLEHAGAGLEHVVSLRVFSTDMDNRGPINRARAEVFDTPPASTHVQVVRLVRPEWLVEIEAMAFVPATGVGSPASSSGGTR